MALDERGIMSGDAARPTAQGRATHIPGRTDGVPMTEEMVRAGAEAIRGYLLLDVDEAVGARGAAMLAYAAMRRAEPQEPA